MKDNVDLIDEINRLKMEKHLVGQMIKETDNAGFNALQIEEAVTRENDWSQDILYEGGFEMPI